MFAERTHSAEPLGEALTKVRLQDLLAQVIAQFPEASRRLLRISVADEMLCAVLPRKATAQSLVALIQNALDANLNQRPICIEATEDACELWIAVQDRGEGMPAHVLRRIAEPFFTTKDPGKGMGLGTFLVSTFAERLGGRVVFDSRPGEGTTATLQLPLQSPERIRGAN
jgi:two-component system sensor histidine kinase RegB